MSGRLPGGSAPNIETFALTPMSPTLVTDQNQQMTVTATYSNGDVVDVTASVTWTSSDEDVAPIDADGRIRAGENGTAEITADLGPYSVTTIVTVGEDGDMYNPSPELVTSEYTAVDKDLVRCDPTDDDVTVTLPSAASSTTLIIKNESDSANPIVIACDGGDTIDGQATFTLAVPRGSITLYSDGISDWMVT